MRRLLWSVGSNAWSRRWELLAYPLAAAAAAAASLVPGRLAAYNDPTCDDCAWDYKVRDAVKVKWCLPPGIRPDCGILYANYEYARWVTERVCGSRLCYECSDLFADGCCIYLEPELPCCDDFHIECPYEAC